MKHFDNQDLLELLGHSEPAFRMFALLFLSEGYAEDPKLLEQVFEGWDQWGAKEAFPEFPMLSFVPIAASQVSECCRRATEMVQGRKLTATQTRCAGKLLEQTSRLPPEDLRPHIDDIAKTIGESKIFFRVDLAGIRQRLEFTKLPADLLAQRLDSAVESLSLDGNRSSAFIEGLHSLESLRRQHPDYMNLAGVLAQSPPDNGMQAVSFQLTLHSLIEFSEPGLEPSLEPHLRDNREVVHANAVEALVRAGSEASAHIFLRQYADAELPNRRWITRGLQRVRTAGLADKIAQLRESTDEPTIWLMLLVAEIRQFDLSSLDRISQELDRVASFSGALMEALNVYVRIHESAVGARGLQNEYMNYLKKVNQDIEANLRRAERETAAESNLTDRPTF